MKKTGKHAWFDGAGNLHTVILECESVGKSGHDTIWKEVNDAHSCYLFYHGLFHPYEPRECDELGELYGTYINEDGERVEA